MTYIKESPSSQTQTTSLHPSMALHPDFAKAFSPQSVAVVGASRNISLSKPNWWDEPGGFVPKLLRLGFPGRIYPINPKADEILGLKAYPNLTSLPEVPEMVVVAIPGRFLPQVLEECIAIGAKNIHVYSSGFTETGTREGKDLQQRVRDIALRGQLRILGPNCMGIHAPARKFSTIVDTANRPGGASFIAQSGGHAINFIHYSLSVDLGVSKVISFGNALVLDSTDLLEYLVVDPSTKFIGMYLEGVRNGRRLLELVRGVNQAKPVIIWKGGLSEFGSRAAASHTGSLAGQAQVWDAFFKQTGAVRANSVDEVVDIMSAFAHLEESPAGTRVALVGSGGGNSVAAADICAKEGVVLPVLSDATVEALRDFIQDAGNIFRNPLDLSFVEHGREDIGRAVELVASDPSVDVLMVVPNLYEYARGGGKEVERQIAQDLSRIAASSTNGKPLIAVISERIKDRRWKIDLELVREELTQAGVLNYSSLSRACRVLAKLTAYRARTSSH